MVGYIRHCRDHFRFYDYGVRLEKAFFLALILPYHPAHHADFDKPPDAYLHALQRTWQQDIHVELAAFAPLATHVPSHVPKRNVPDELGEVPRQVVAGDVAVDAPDADQLPDLMRSAQGLHKAARSSALFRHGQK
ncbi:hypothetical protein [Mesorhizobium sophorae]|uniref:hypothetical protein n=1 Tax=Mesorhizobium sophorae TaxID=1300294 RepID=UPI00142E1C6D|nr:hypothetical protein [Mesorhizobium sophorae]